MTKSDETVVYTCSINKYDNFSLFQKPVEGIRFIFFTTNPNNVPEGWEGRKLQSPPRLTTGHDINRFHKIFAHHVLPKYRYSIYFDGNVNFNGNIYNLIKRYQNSNVAMAAFRHPERRPLIEEVEACENHNKFDTHDRDRVKAQFPFYESEDLDLTQAISANGLLIRDHSNENLKHCMSLWWSHLFEYSKRDQLSLNYALWKSNTSWAFIDDDLGFDPSSFIMHRHARKTPLQKLKKFFTGPK